MSEDDLVRRLQVGHDSGCAMSYGMHEHCCDCSYPYRQESAETILKLRQDLAAARALLREVEWDVNGKCPICTGWKMPEGEMRRRHTDNCPLRAAIAGQRREGE